MFNLLGFNESIEGPLGPVELTPEQQAAIKRQGMEALGAQLLALSGPSRERVGFGQAFAQGVMAKNQAVAQAQQRALMAAQYKQQQQERLAAQQRQKAVQEALARGDIAGAAMYDPQAANAYRQATAVAAKNPLVLGPNQVAYNPDGSVLARGERPDEKPVTQVVDGVLYQWTGGKWVPQTEKAPDPKLADAARKASARLAEQRASAENVLATVEEAKAIVKNEMGTTGAIGLINRNIGGTDARTLQARIETIKGNLGFDRLQQMRENSPTGGALGQVAVQELQALQATVASLDQGLSAGQLEVSLDRIEKHYKRWLQAVEQAQMGGQNGLIAQGAKLPQYEGWSAQVVGGVGSAGGR